MLTKKFSALSNLFKNLFHKREKKFSTLTKKQQEILSEIKGGSVSNWNGSGS